MKVIEFVLLLYIGNGELIEYTVRDGLTDCLKTKRTIERNMQIETKEEYEGGARWSCQKLHVEIDEGGNILGFVDGVPAVGGK